MAESTPTLIWYDLDVPAGIVPSVHTGTPFGSSAQPTVSWNVTPAGSVSVTRTSRASLGPALVTVTVYVSVSPATTGSGASALAIPRSARPITVVSIVTVSLFVFGSPVLDVTVAVLRIRPSVAESTPTLIWYDLDVPAGIVPSVHTGTPFGSSAQPTVSWNVTPAGSVSVTRTSRASLGPALVTVTVYVSVSPATTGSGASALAIPRSARPITVVSIVTVLLFGFGSPVLNVTVAVLRIRPSVAESTPTLIWYDLRLSPPESCPACTREPRSDLPRGLRLLERNARRQRVRDAHVARIAGSGVGHGDRVCQRLARHYRIRGVGFGNPQVGLADHRGVDRHRVVVGFGSPVLERHRGRVEDQT